MIIFVSSNFQIQTDKNQSESPSGCPGKSIFQIDKELKENLSSVSGIISGLNNKRTRAIFPLSNT